MRYLVTGGAGFIGSNIVDGAKLVVDSRNATRHVRRHREKIVLC